MLSAGADIQLQSRQVEEGTLAADARPRASAKYCQGSGVRDDDDASDDVLMHCIDLP